MENLLSNAVKYTRTRERAMIEVGSSGDEEETAFFVRDNDVGFNVQYSINSSGCSNCLYGTGEFEGTGIELANAWRIVRRHGDRVWAEARVKKGPPSTSRFCDLRRVNG